MPSFTPSFTPKPTSQKILIYDFAVDDDSGQPSWYFVGVSPSRSEEFLAALDKKDGTIDLSEYGKILASGRGMQVPEAVREVIYRQYSTNN